MRAAVCLDESRHIATAGMKPAQNEGGLMKFKQIAKSGLIVILTLTMFGSLKAGEWEDSIDALNKKDYSTALQILTPLAQKGDARAQCNLGTLFVNGWGVETDYEQGAKWFRLAANQVNANGQYNLVTMYFNGIGVPEDLELAYFWVTLASKDSEMRDGALKAMNIISSGLTDQQKNIALQKANEWKPAVSESSESEDRAETETE